MHQICFERDFPGRLSRSTNIEKILHYIKHNTGAIVFSTYPMSNYVCFMLSFRWLIWLAMPWPGIHIPAIIERKHEFKALHEFFPFTVLCCYFW